MSSLRRAPITFLAAVFTLSLGIAAATVMFTLIYSVMLRPLPYVEPESLIALQPRLSWGDILNVESHAKTIRASAVYRKRTWAFTDDESTPVEVVLSGMVTHGFFDSLGIAPQSGVPFSAEMEVPGANRVMWLTDGFWHRHFGARGGVVGSTVRLNDEPYRIAGILPAGFRFPMHGENPEVFIPLDRKEYCCQQESRTLAGVGRLAKGSSPRAAQEELTAIVGHGIRVEDLQSALLGNRARPLLFLGLACSLVLFVSAMNAASILLTRATRDIRNISIKMSLGAQASNLVGEFLLQGVLIGSAASVLGWLIGSGIFRWMRSTPDVAEALRAYENVASLSVDWRAAVFASIVALVTAVGAALVPAWIVQHAGVDRRLLQNWTELPRSLWSRQLLVAAQLALSCILLSMGAVILDELRTVIQADRGFRTEQIVVAGIGIPEKRYDTDLKMISFHQEVIGKLGRIPGVLEAGAGTGMPFGERAQFQPFGQTLRKADRPWAMISIVSANLLSMLDVPLVEGRGFNDEDRYNGRMVALVNRKFVERYPMRIGARVQVPFWGPQMKPWPEAEIVGVVSDFKNVDLDRASEPAIYLSITQIPMEGMRYFARTALPASALVQPFRDAVWSVDRNLERVTPRPLIGRVENGLQSRRLAMLLVSAFGVVSFVLAVFGLSATVSAWVTESERQIGIRMALGQSPAAVLCEVIGRSARIAAAAVFIALPLTLVASRMFRSQVPGLRDAPPAPMLAVMGLILLVAMAASVPAALRAARTSPADILKRS